MKARKNRLTLTFVAAISTCLIVASAEAQTQAYRSPRSNSSSHLATTQPYKTTYVTPPPPIKQSPIKQPPMKSPKAPAVYTGPVLTMALPTAGPYQSGLKIGRQPEFAVQPVSFTPPPRTANPFPTMNEQVSRISEKTPPPPTSYLGDTPRASGQGAAQLAIRRALYGNIGMSGYYFPEK